MYVEPAIKEMGHESPSQKCELYIETFKGYMLKTGKKK